jgi:general secretion pathway protein K
MRRPSPQSTGQGGFALAAALWLLAGLTIVVSLVNDAAVTSAERVRQLRERSDFVRSSLANRARLLHFVALGSPQAASFSLDGQELFADETPYKFDAISVLRIQDAGGLINLNRIDRPVLERFLQTCGVPDEQVPFLSDALEDYIDSDDLQRVNGIEKDGYALAGKPPPRNAPLLSVEEVWQVFGWAAFKTAFVTKGCNRALTVQGNTPGALNVATAPAIVLRSLGVDEAAASDVIVAKSDAIKLADRMEKANVQSGNVGMFGMSSSRVRQELRVTHEHAQQPWVMQYTLAFDFTKDDKPWSIAQPVISARGYEPAVPASQALSWPQTASGELALPGVSNGPPGLKSASSDPSPSSVKPAQPASAPKNANPVLPF